MSRMKVEVWAPPNNAECSLGSARLQTGLLMINADDWGRERETTERTLECLRLGSISSVSAMVFMQDSERAAAVAREQEICAGLHLNLTTQLSAAHGRTRLVEHHQRISAYLRMHRFTQAIFHAGLASSFRYVVEAQLEEFRRLFGAEADRIDGHHHAHLCANVIFQKLLPAGTLVRRNFTFQKHEKGFFNRAYRRFIDRTLRQRHEILDYLFTLQPVEGPERIERIFTLARHFRVEVETHPVVQHEYDFLTSGEFFRRTRDFPIATGLGIRRLSRRPLGGVSLA